MSKYDKQILGVNQHAIIHNAPFLLKSGVFTGSEQTALSALEPGLMFGRRQWMEEDNRFRQIIPYIVIRRGSEFLTYVRAVTGGENRLHGRMSLGIGGHIEFSDARNCHGIRKSAGGLNLSDIIEYAMCREVEEELGSGVMMNLCLRRFVGLLIDNSDEVGQVHLGYVLLFDVPDHWEWTRPEADEGEEGPAEFTEIKFMTLDEIANATNVQREGWVDLLLPALAPYALTGANSLKGQAVQ